MDWRVTPCTHRLRCVAENPFDLGGRRTSWILKGRLLEAQRHGDGDYRELIHEIVPAVLGVRRDEDSWGNSTGVFVDRLAELEDHLDLPAWLAQHQAQLHRRLYGADLAEAAALEAVTTAIADLELPEIVRQLDRLRRDLTDDLPAAVGHAKELVESCGGKLHSYFFELGTYDGLAICEFPDTTSATAASLIAASTGSFTRFETTALMTAKEAEAAMKIAHEKASRYKSPKG